MTTRIKSFLKEPFLHFLLIGFVIFISSFYLLRRRESHKILIDKAVIAKLTMAWETQFGRTPNSNELKIALDDYIKQEVLVKEAQQLGLNQDDEIIKRRLQQKMAFIIKDNIVVPDPSLSVLETYYRENAPKFSEAPKVFFSHIYFSADNSSSEKAKQRAITVLHSMDSKPAPSRAPELGDHFMLLYDYNDINKTEAQGLFGDSQFTDSLFTVKENRWRGPFLSGYGWHLLYVNKRLTNAVPPLSQIKDRVIDSYKNDQLNKLDNEAIEKLVEKYTIELKLD
ncbi:MAG TPA: peptidylprolyl isomerase [Puia sp.]|nr:peptidylprolyl isomerase [Puia sp.]